MDIKIPFLGDGIESANVVSILVKPGDSVSIDQTVIELETDKATAPVPSTVSGKVSAVLVNEGDLVKEGMVVVQLAGNAEHAPDASPAPQASAPSPAPSVPTVSPVAAIPDAPAYQSVGNPSAVAAAPSIIKFSRLSGLDLGRIPGSGHGGRITWDDVQRYVNALQSAMFSNQSSAGSVESPTRKSTKPPINFESFGPVTRQPLTSLRQKISDHLWQAWHDIPHVTQFGDIQMDAVMALRKTVNASAKPSDIKLSVTVFVLKAIAQTLAAFKTFNASLVDNELVIKDYIHLGVAVDTESGLVVPVIRDVDKKSLQTIAAELDQLAEKARSKSLALSDIQGATFTLSNLGGLGASYFTPIVNSPEVAILGTGRAQQRVVLDDSGKVSNVLQMPIALSYDHRVIDGADGARFVQALTKNIESFDEEWVN